MPKVEISTYSSLLINSDVVKVNKIISEQEFVPNVKKEVSFGKYSKKLALHCKEASNEACLNR